MQKINWNSPELSNISKEKLAWLNSIIDETKSSPDTSSFAYWSSIMTRLNSSNVKFTPDEEARILNVLAANMTPSERAKFNFIKSIIKK